MWFKDLSPYQYTLSIAGWPSDGPPQNRPDGLFHWMMGGDAANAFADPEVNVGWLEKDHPFNVGPQDPQTVSLLESICRSSRYALARGVHNCEFCGRSIPGLGSAEIRIQGHGVVYASPNLVCHFMSAHGYMPPIEFVTSVASSGGRQATPVPGRERVIPSAVLNRESVDWERFRESVCQQLVSSQMRRDLRSVEVSLPQDGCLIVSVKWAIRAEEVDSSVWSIPIDAILTHEQGVIGITSMIQRRYGEESAKALREARKK